MDNVLILGSCVSRDVFNFNDKYFHIVAYHARSSLATLANSTSLINHSFKLNISNIASSFQRKMVEGDFSMSVLTSLKTISFDKLLIDFIDERFHLAILNENQDVVTRSNEFLKTKIKPIGIIDKYSDLYFEKWCKGLDCLCDILKTTKQLDKVRVQKAFWTNQLDNGKKLSDYEDQIIKKENDKLNKMYNYLESKIHKNQFIEIPNELIIINSLHKWGLSPFHYIDDYYLYVIEKLK